ncbi:MAG: type I-B CRISPR-associated protein Cas7/Csh2 [Synergistetes bacterium HGW-Synergistetes-2]|nr:MAG: type I-B CRISPR-associated protein Cas7/Csh2 [Synergistetes bacterium HGW-Synergistetes-2]
MAFEKRRELLFVYSVKDANPNGDPLNNNAPRKDEETGQILVSDVRIKRTVRDQWIREGKDVFVDGEAQTLKERVDALKKKHKVSSAADALKKCIDARLFGVTCAIKKEEDSSEEKSSKGKGKSSKESFSWCGPLQLKWARSLHKVREQFVQGTAAFARKEESEQRSFRNEYIVPFCMLACYGIANQHASTRTEATDDDLDDLFKTVWNGTANLISRSKVGHVPLLLLEITYKKDFDGCIGALDERVRLTDANGNPFDEDAQYALRSATTVQLDITALAQALETKKNEIERLRLVYDQRLVIKGKEELAPILGGKISEEAR